MHTFVLPIASMKVRLGYQWRRYYCCSNTCDNTMKRMNETKLALAFDTCRVKDKKQTIILNFYVV